MAAGKQDNIIIMGNDIITWDHDANDMGTMTTRWRAMHAVEVCHGNVV